MKNFISCLIMVSLVSCGSVHKRENFNYKSVQSPWINSFKETVFIECLKQSYGNDTILVLIGKKDLLNTYDGIDFSDLDNAKSIGKEIAINIPDPEYKFDDYKIGQKYYMSSCLRFYASRELDSIAHVEYKKHLNNSQ